MFQIKIIRANKILTWDELNITLRPANYKTDEDFVRSIFRDGYINAKIYDNSKLDKHYDINVINVDTRDVIYKNQMSKTALEHIYYLLASMEWMELIHVRSLSTEDIFKQFVSNILKVMEINDSETEFQNHIEPAINRNFKQYQYKLISCDIKEFDKFFETLWKTYHKSFGKKAESLSHEKFYTIIYMARDSYRSMIQIKNRT